MKISLQAARKLRKVQSSPIFILVQRDLRHAFGIFTRSVRVKPLLNCYTVSAPQTQAPPTLLHAPSSRIRIVLLDIKGGVRNVSQSRMHVEHPRYTTIQLTLAIIFVVKCRR